MLAATLLALGAAGSVAAATETCFPLQHFQWAPAGAGAGYLGVTLTNPGIDPWVVDGEIAFATSDWLQDILIEWIFDTGSIKLNGYDVCLDAGLPPFQNGTPLKIWKCYDDIPQQVWELQDGRIKLVDTNMCVDVTDGNIEAGYVQLWECSPGNTNQKWSTILV